MAKLNDREISFLRLLMRSPNTGDGWKTVSRVLWRLVDDFGRPELIEVDKFTAESEKAGRVRLSEAGKIIAKYLV